MSEKEKSKGGLNKLYDQIPENWEDCYGWYYYADAIRVHTNSKYYTRKEEKGNSVYHCELCNKQWQFKTIIKGKRSYDFYHDLPTYGLKRKHCVHCTKDPDSTL